MKPIMISLQMIRDNLPCSDRWSKVLASKGKTKSDDEMFPVSDIFDSNDYDDVLWTLRCLPEYDHLWRKFAWWCSKQSLQYTDDPRVSECLDVVWRHSNGEATNEELSAAGSAARSAAWSARSAAWSAQETKLRQLLEAGEWVEGV